MADSFSESLATWFKNQPAWLQQAAADYFLGVSEIDDTALSTYRRLAESEASGDLSEIPATVETGRILTSPAETPYTIDEIGDIVGVNRLQGTTPLKFPDKRLTVIYGHNATGKSGFVKLLKHATGKHTLQKLLPNVFHKSSPTPSCTIKTSLGEFPWISQGDPILDLSSVQIFDAELANQFRFEEYSLAFEPPVLAAFDALVLLCDRLRTDVHDDIRASYTRLPTFPEILRTTRVYDTWTKVNARTKRDSVESSFDWNEEHDKKLAKLREEIVGYGSAEILRSLKNEITLVEALGKRVKDQAISVAQDAFESIIALSEESASLDKLANEESSTLFDKTFLAGLGTATWMHMWESAKHYAESQAYPEKDFPHLGAKSRCVLCQQYLSEDAQRRFAAFRDFVASDLKTNSEKVKQQLSKALPNEKLWITQKDLEIQSKQFLPEDQHIALVTDYDQYIRRRATELVDPESRKKLIPYIEPALLIELRKAWDQRKQRLNELQKPDALERKQKLLSEQTELEARKWASEQINSVVEEIERLQYISILNRTKTLCDTAELTNEKKRLARELSHHEVQRRFKDELKVLCNKDMPVDLRDPRGEKARILTKVVLRGASANLEPSQILSEGEQRAVALAAFLSDSCSIGNVAPFVFDDPVSSLDHRFEDRLAARLVSLSQERQVIVFSHRLTFVHALEERAKKSGKSIELLYMSAFEGIYGRVSEEWPFKESSLKKRINKLLDHSIPSLRKAAEEGDEDLYRAEQEKVCIQMRECVEQSIELNLCGGVVTRFSKELRTKGERLVRIATASLHDCSILDDLMTRYSYDVHQQPSERPYIMPEYDQLERDISTLASWFEEFNARCMGVSLPLKVATVGTKS